MRPSTGLRAACLAAVWGFLVVPSLLGQQLPATNPPPAAVTAPAPVVGAVSSEPSLTSAPSTNRVETPAEIPPRPKVRLTAKALEKPLLEERNWAESLYEILIARKLTLGASRSSYELTETVRPADRDGGATFIGYVNVLEQIDEDTTRLVVGYHPCRYLAFQYTEDEVAARTRNYNNDLSDGVVRMFGPIYTGVVRVPIFDRIFPFVGISYAPWETEFVHEPWWHLGWPSPEAHALAGSPNRTVGHSRTIEVEDDTCRYTTYGVTIKLHRYVEFDATMRDIELNTPARFYTEAGGNRTLERTGDFPLSHKSYALALRVVF